MSVGADAQSDAPPALRVAGWGAIRGLAHGFFGRAGGVSVGACAWLNVSGSVGDDPSAVASNWQRIARALPGLRFVRMRQVHGAQVVLVDCADTAKRDADGMIAHSAGLGLAVLTADCV